MNEPPPCRNEMLSCLPLHGQPSPIRQGGCKWLWPVALPPRAVPFSTPPQRSRARGLSNRGLLTVILARHFVEGEHVVWGAFINLCSGQDRDVICWQQKVCSEQSGRRCGPESRGERGREQAES